MNNSCQCSSQSCNRHVSSNGACKEDLGYCKAFQLNQHAYNELHWPAACGGCNAGSLNPVIGMWGQMVHARIPGDDATVSLQASACQCSVLVIVPY